MMRSSIFLLVSAHIASVAPNFSQEIRARGWTLSLVAARMTSLKTEMVVLAVESRDHVKGVLTWVIVMMLGCKCECSRLEMRSLEMLLIG